MNDYLARRDSTWKAPLFEFHGLTVDCIDNHQPNSPNEEKHTEMQILLMEPITNLVSITFVITWRMLQKIWYKRKHNYAIVDEVDSVLIDDARTPLIISGPVPQGDRHEFLN